MSKVPTDRIVMAEKVIKDLYHSHICPIHYQRISNAKVDPHNAHISFTACCSELSDEVNKDLDSRSW